MKKWSGTMGKGIRSKRREIIIIIHLLGLAPAGYLTAPDNGPRAVCEVVQVNATVVALCH
jgi:hypothetical protein